MNGAWLRVRDTPAQTDRGLPPVVFVHGYGSRLEAWRELQPRLARSRRVVSFDQRGFGQSSRSKADYGPEQHAADVLAMMDTLGIDAAILVGHSYGGGVVLRAALDAPKRVLGVGLVSAFALEQHLPTDFRWAKIPVVGELLFGAFYKEVPGEKYLLAFEDRERFVSLEALDEMEAMMDRPGATYTALATVRGMDYTDAERAYRDITVPMVVVWGEDDRVVPLDAGKDLAAAVDAPLVVLSACGHMPSWERPRSLLKALAPMMAEAAYAEPAPERLPIVQPEPASDAPARSEDQDQSDGRSDPDDARPDARGDTPAAESKRADDGSEPDTGDAQVDSAPDESGADASVDDATEGVGTGAPEGNAPTAPEGSTPDGADGARDAPPTDADDDEARR